MVRGSPGQGRSLSIARETFALSKDDEVVRPGQLSGQRPDNWVIAEHPVRNHLPKAYSSGLILSSSHAGVTVTSLEP